MAVCAFVNLGLFFNQTWHEAPLAPLWGAAGRSESFKSVIVGGNHTAQGMVTGWYLYQQAPTHS